MIRPLIGAVTCAGGILLLLVLTLLALGILPTVGLSALWSGAVGDSVDGHLYPLSETLVKGCPLLLTGLGVTVAWRAGLFSIGGEGQLMMGALCAAAISRLLPSAAGPLLAILMLAGGSLAGAFWGAVAGWLRVRRNVQEVISTIMLNYIALYLLGWAVRGPLQDRSSHLAQSDPIPAAALLPHLIPASLSGGIGTRLHLGVLLAVLMVPVVSCYLYRTADGFALRLVGENPEAARTAHIPADAIRMRAMALSGALCGMAGTVELLGMTGRLYSGFSSGWGFTAIPVALLGGLAPAGVLISAIFFGGLAAGSGNLSRFSGVSSVLTYVIQAITVLAVVGFRSWQTAREPGSE